MLEVTLKISIVVLYFSTTIHLLQYTGFLLCCLISLYVHASFLSLTVKSDKGSSATDLAPTDKSNRSIAFHHDKQAIITRSEDL